MGTINKRLWKARALLGLLQVERELEQHRQGMDGIGTSKKDYEDARLALAEHTKNHDHHSRYP
jgi:hypothetical protein